MWKAEQGFTMAMLALTVAALAGAPSSLTRIVSRAACTSSSVASRINVDQERCGTKGLILRFLAPATHL